MIKIFLSLLLIFSISAKGEEVDAKIYSEAISLVVVEDKEWFDSLGVNWSHNTDEHQFKVIRVFGPGIVDSSMNLSVEYFINSEVKVIWTVDLNKRTVSRDAGK